MKPVTEISRLYFELQSYIQQLKIIISAGNIIQATCYQLPVIAPDTKELPTLHQRVIDVMPTDNQYLAIAMANKHYSQFTFTSETSKRFALRCPGIIQLPRSLTKEVGELVSKINAIKDEIKYILNIKSNGKSVYMRQEKFNLLREAIPGAIALQLYRKITCIEEPLCSVSFTWANKQSVTKIDLKTLCQMLEDNKQKVPAGSTQENWLSCVQREIKLICETNATHFKIRRPIPANPMANLRFSDNSRLMRHAHLPIIIFGDAPVKVSPLKTYEPNIGHFRTRLEIEDYLIERLKIIPVIEG